MGQNDWDCDYCDETFTSEAERIRHTLDEHGDELTGHQKDSLKSRRNKLDQQVAQQKQRRTTDLKRYGKGLTALFLLLIVGYGTYSSGLIQIQRNPDTAPTGPIHYHPQLRIVINGETRPVPTNIGIGPQYADNPYYHGGMQMTSIHTHDSSGTLHWEIMNRAPKDGELQLGAFFDIWGKTFNETCLFDYCNTDEKQVTMTVNGKENKQFGNHTIQGNERIVIRYE